MIAAPRWAIRLLALVLAFGAGFYTEGRFQAARETRTLRQEARQTARNVAEATQKSVAIETAISNDATRIDSIKARVAARVSKYRPKETAYVHEPAVPHGPDADDFHAAAPAERPACADAGLVLDLGTVRLLNAARQGPHLDAAGGRHGQEPSVASADGAARPDGDQASVIDLAALAADSLEITKMYRDLAKRHDELVDAVNKKLQEQGR